ncbi:cytidylyltransferase domain-containing protein [Mesoflavibacter zeaxanthinifaciens]|uniref:acylneuraminate cytidylyltransferase family protein n=1 Tax=Mesoflavibacter zeaxanthinifaciens TaxID=393060 RepID=UPI003A930970
MKILGLIPARGGSKGIPNKNRKVLNGKPLLQYTIEAALGSKLLNKVVFSSEDETLIKLAKSLGAEVPFVRPSNLSNDNSGTLEVVQHAIKKLKENGNDFDAVCLLQVTNPFRTSELIDKAIKKFEISGTDTLLSVLKVPHEYNPHWTFKVSESGYLKLATGENRIIKRRQDLPDAYHRDGAIYLVKTDIVLNQNTLYGKTISYIESNSKLHINIDTAKDWEKAVEMAKKLYL